MSLPENLKASGASDSTAETLLSFFTDPGDWAYVMDYKRYGVVSAMVTHREDEQKRIVVELKDRALFSVVRLGITPVGMYAACQLDPLGHDWIGDPDYYTTFELFKLFSLHATRP